jgi:hypothetical protein
MAKQPAATVQVDETLRTVVTTETFSNRMLSRDYQSGKLGVTEDLPTKPKLTQHGLSEYAKNLKRVTSLPSWVRPSAVLGRPGYNCWLSTNRFGDGPDLPDYGSDHATRVRDELGLINHGKEVALLQFTFVASDALSLAGFESARPTFADLGN